MITQSSIVIQCRQRSLIDITSKVVQIVNKFRVKEGLCNVFLPHTSASLVFSENADSDVKADLEAFMNRLVPDGDPIYKHTAEGEDDMPAHVRMVLTQNSLMIPVSEGKLLLGTWQGVFLWEHRFAPHERKVLVTVMGDD